MQHAQAADGEQGASRRLRAGDEQRLRVRVCTRSRTSGPLSGAATASGRCRRSGASLVSVAAVREVVRPARTARGRTTHGRIKTAASPRAVGVRGDGGAVLAEARAPACPCRPRAPAAPCRARSGRAWPGRRRPAPTTRAARRPRRRRSPAPRRGGRRTCPATTRSSRPSGRPGTAATSSPCPDREGRVAGGGQRADRASPEARRTSADAAGAAARTARAVTRAMRTRRRRLEARDDGLDGGARQRALAHDRPARRTRSRAGRSPSTACPAARRRRARGRPRRGSTPGRPPGGAGPGRRRGWPRLEHRHARARERGKIGDADAERRAAAAGRSGTAAASPARAAGAPRARACAGRARAARRAREEHQRRRLVRRAALELVDPRHRRRVLGVARRP